MPLKRGTLNLPIYSFAVLAKIANPLSTLLPQCTLPWSQYCTQTTTTTVTVAIATWEVFRERVMQITPRMRRHDVRNCACVCARAIRSSMPRRTYTSCARACLPCSRVVRRYANNIHAWQTWACNKQFSSRHVTSSHSRWKLWIASRSNSLVLATNWTVYRFKPNASHRLHLYYCWTIKTTTAVASGLVADVGRWQLENRLWRWWDLFRWRRSKSTSSKQVCESHIPCPECLCISNVNTKLSI